ncbi:MAG: sodium ion-translocating decarboxylase subunit beta [Dehalococcoidia bacterium]
MDFPFDTGFHDLTWGNCILILLGLVFIYLAIAKKWEPYVLLPIGAGVILANLPLTGLMIPPNEASEPAQAGLLGIITYYGIFYFTVLPKLIFLGLGAMTDFSPLLANPKGFLLGAAAQIGIFFSFAGALALGYWGVTDFGLREASAIAIIGGADGPTTIYATAILSPELLGITAATAYSYMAMVSLIQPPIIRALTTETERKIYMQPQLRDVSKLEMIIFPLILLLGVCLLVPRAAPLVGLLAVGNLLRVSGVVERLSQTAQTTFVDVITILLMLGIGASMPAELVIKKDTLIILALGLAAFSFSTAGGTLMGKLMSRISKTPFNPIVGAAGVSAVPMAARVAHYEGQRANPRNFLLLHAMGPNVAGVIGSAVVAGVFLGMLD